MFVKCSDPFPELPQEVFVLDISIAELNVHIADGLDVRFAVGKSTGDPLGLIPRAFVGRDVKTVFLKLFEKTAVNVLHGIRAGRPGGKDQQG